MWQTILSALFAVLATVGLAACDPASKEGRVMLVSIIGVTLDEMQFVEGLSVDMENLRVLAICNVPPGWDMQANSPMGPTTGVKGGASGSVAALETDDLNELRGLFLVRTKEYTGVSPLGYKMGGSLDIEVRGEEPSGFDFPLQPSNFVLESADRCPPRKW